MSNTDEGLNGLKGDTSGPTGPSREDRRRQRVAQMFKAVPDYEALLRLRETDPAQFEAVVTQGGLRLSVVQYQQARATAIAEGTYKPDGDP